MWRLARILAVAALSLCGAVAAGAEPLRCSGEHQGCVAVCAKINDTVKMRTCNTACSQRRGVCLRTGCWNDGRRNTCGLLRQ